MKTLRDFGITIILVFAVLAMLFALANTKLPGGISISQQQSTAPAVTDVAAVGTSIPTVTPLPIASFTPVVTVVFTQIPTATPGAGSKALWTVTPISVNGLPSPQPGLASGVGRVLCGGTVARQQFIYIIRIEGDSYSLVQVGRTDENGRWFLPDAVPGIYSVTLKSPDAVDLVALGNWQINANQVLDFGDISFDVSSCSQ